ncbi:MAG: ATP-binding protein [Nanoarchaeota archaeon]
MVIDAAVQIEKFKDFLESQYNKKINEIINSGKTSLVVDFIELSKFDLELSEELLESPEETIKAGDIALSQLGVFPNNLKRIRFFNLPESQSVTIRNIRSVDLNKFISVLGIVRQASDVRPQVTMAKFECPSCGNSITIPQLDSKFKEPSRCSCGRRGKFRLLSKDLVDVQRLIIEEAPETLEGGDQPKRIAVFLSEDLVEPRMEKKTTPGSKVKIMGLVKEIPLISKSGAQSTRYDLIIESNYIEPTDEIYEEIDISPEDEAEIRKLSSDENIYEKLRDSIAPSIYGHGEIKEALSLQMFGGVRKVKDDGTKQRGDMHILLVGDPGSGKSQTLQFIAKAAPKARFISGRGASLEFNEPIIIRKNGSIEIVNIGSFVDNNCQNLDEVFVRLKEYTESLSLNLTTKKIEWKPIKAVYRHKHEDRLLKFDLESGREVSTTKDHSIFILENGKTITKPAKDLKIGDCVLIPSKIPTTVFNNLHPEVARFIGYYLAEGHMRNKEGSYKIELTLNKKETDIIEDIKKIAKKHFDSEIKVYNHGLNGIRVVMYGKMVYNIFKELLGDVAHKKAKEKYIPTTIFNSNFYARNEFIKGYISGDAGVTKSKRLMSDLLYLYLQNGIMGSCNKRNDSKSTKINGRCINGVGYRYDLKSPKIGRKFLNLYKNPPLDKIGNLVNKRFLVGASSSKYSRARLYKMSNSALLSRLNFMQKNNVVCSKELKPIFGGSILEYFADNDDIFIKTKIGREMFISLSETGTKLMEELNDFRLIMDSDLGFVRIKSIKEVESNSPYVYDISVFENENFVGGFGGVICHNTGAGITATVVKDEFLRGWALEAGAMVLANKGMAIIDELDKMSPEDRSALHEALEQQTVTISKANIQATLRAETTVLAAANPKTGRFDPYTPIAAQIDLPPTLINRFDLIFPVKDIPNREKDEKIARHVLGTHQNPNAAQPVISSRLLKKYISYARQNYNPVLTDTAINEIIKFYVGLRNEGNVGDESGINRIPITARQLEALVRLSEASARVRLSDKVTKKDAQRAIKLLEYCLMQIGIDRETGKIDIDKISIGITATTRSRIHIIKETIDDLEARLGKTIPLEELVIEAVKRGIDEDKVEELVENMKRSGDIFEPKRGFIQKI